MNFLVNVPRHIADALEKGSIKTLEQVMLTSDSYYLETLNFCMDDIKIIKSLAASHLLPQGIKNAQEIYEIENSLQKNSSGCEIIDKYLHGGLRVGTITEVYGESGCGKTQLALQFTVHCWNKGAVYISTEDIFPSKRLQQMLSHMQSRQNDKKDITQYGEKIFIMEIIEVEDLKNCINSHLPRLIDTKGNISLVVIDSITGPFRSDFQNDMKTRAQHLKEIGMSLMKLATKYNFAVLCTNQVLATMDLNDSDETVMPCLGLTWSNLLTSRIKVKKIEKYCRAKDIKSNELHVMSDDNIIVQVRQMQIITSPELPSTDCIEYVILQSGVNGLKV